MDKKQLQMIAAIGGAATVLGVFLPWASIDIPEALRSLIKVDTTPSGISTSDGKIVLILALVGAALAGALFLGKSLPISGKASILTAWICLGVAALICVIDFFDIGEGASVGIGLWLCVLGSIAGAVTGFMAWKQMGGQVPKAAPSDGGDDAGGGES